MSKPKKYSQYYTQEKPVKCTQVGFEHRDICQGCLEEGHVQLPSSEAFDCKMVFIDEDNKQHGQCCCYAKEHGLRKDDS
jgi:hypothetical protein